MVRPISRLVAIGLLGAAPLASPACSALNAPDDPVAPAAGGAGAVGGAAGHGAVGGGACGPLNTLEHCGACGNPCEPANAAGASCASGSCTYASCSGAYQDCDGDRANGCESDPAADVDHCGGCNQPCLSCEPPCDGVQNVTAAVCDGGSCGYTDCVLGAGDCDGDPTNGCERPVTTLAECGDCNLPCSPANATGPDCSGGVCTYAACVAPYDDCDAVSANGCETDTDTDDAHCGGCDAPCSGTDICSGGSCVPPPCSVQYNILSLADRNVSFNDGNGGIEYCDDPGGSQGPQWLGAGWYRITGAAGSRMPETPPVDYSCGTDAPGWLNGAHPAQLDGVVTRQACFSWVGNPCNWFVDVQVVNCGAFYLYQLPEAGICAVRYCGSQ